MGAVLGWRELAFWPLLLVLVPIQGLAATVPSIGDGDTITVIDRCELLHVGFACIDAPETAQIPFGGASRRTLQDPAPLGIEVTLRIKSVDRYGRTVAEVSHGQSNLGRAMVAAGQAFVYGSYADGCDREAYARLENDARRRRLGIWSEPGGLQRPWSFRKQLRHGAQKSRQQRGQLACGRVPDGDGAAGQR